MRPIWQRLLAVHHVARNLHRAWLLIAALPLMGHAAGPAAPAACIAPLSYIALEARVVGMGTDGAPALGAYERISPDGRFVLRSYSGAKLGEVSLIELPDRAGEAIRAHPTPLSNEAFPVQGSWRYLVDINGEHYRFRDVLEHGREAQPLFQGGMTGFYAVASEMPVDAGVNAHGASARHLPTDFFVRSLSWPQGASSRDQGVGPLQVETLRIHDDGHTAAVVQNTGSQFICGHRVSIDGNAFALPMLSVDGAEFSAIPQAPHSGQPSMRVYGLSADAMSADHSCALLADLQATASKAVFGFPTAGAPAWLVYSDIGSVYVFDRTLERSFRLDRAMDHVLASAFPGLTRDGRVIFGATWHECPDKSACPKQAGYVVVDPYQSTEYRRYWQEQGQTPPKACITGQEVHRERARFARLHGLDIREADKP